METAVANAPPAVGPAHVDYFYRGQAFGNVASKLLAANMDVRALRVNNETLRRDEWLALDKAIVNAVTDRLVVVNLLVGANCVFDMQGRGLAKTVLAYQTMTQAGSAGLSMDGISEGLDDKPEFGIGYLPLPLIHADYRLNARFLMETRNDGTPLDTLMAAEAGNRVAEKIEDIFLKGASSYAFGGGILYGMTDQPNRNTVSLKYHWNASGVTGQNILDMVQAAKQASLSDGHFGPWSLLIPPAYETCLDNDFKANSDRTIRERILSIDGVNQIKVADRLTAHNVLLVELRPENLRVVMGLQPTNVDWSSHGGLALHYKVMAIILPQFRPDIDGKSGTIHIS